jgi:hypothetical protein
LRIQYQMRLGIFKVEMDRTFSTHVYDFGPETSDKRPLRGRMILRKMGIHETGFEYVNFFERVHDRIL